MIRGHQHADSGGFRWIGKTTLAHTVPNGHPAKSVPNTHCQDTP